MRVLHIGKYFPPYPGGMEAFLGDLLPALERYGVSCAAVVHAASEYSKGTREPVKHAVRLYESGTYGSLLYAPISPCFPLVLDKAIREFSPDILHIHMPNTSAFWLLSSRRAKRIPWVIHWHSDVVQSKHDKRLAWAYQLYRLLESRLLARAQTIIATSLPYLEASPALAPWREKCHIVPLGLDARRYPEAGGEGRTWAESQWQGESFKILAIGRLTYYKGHETLIRAMAGVQGARLILVGEGDRKKSLQRLIKALGVEDRVTLAGYMPDREVSALLETCDVLCLPSIERTEAFGLVLLEAMRFSKPVVASNIPGSGVGWVVRDNEAGLLVHPGDADALAAALNKMEAFPALRREMGEAGKKLFDSSFHIDPIAAHVASLYRGLISVGHVA